MSTAKFTPGPWKAYKWRICRDTGRASEFEYICDTATNAKGRNERNAANAKLIAAAPELYARLRESTALLRSALPPAGMDTTRLYGPIEKQIAANEAAMKKAEGE